MKRILDDPSDSSRVATARRLLQHVPPIGDESSRQRRLRPRILAAAHAPATTRLGQPVMALVLLLASAAAAHGMSGGGFQHLTVQARAWFAGHRARPASLPQAAARVAVNGLEPVEGASATPLAPAPPASLATNAPPTSSRKPTAGRSDLPLPSVHSQAPTAPALKVAAAPATSALSNDPGTQLMVEAMQARRAGDTTRAERLLSEYRRRFPSGALQEEALALSVEAAVLHHSPGAAQLARSYLAQFPHGRYRQWMEQTLTSAPR